MRSCFGLTAEIDSRSPRSAFAPQAKCPRAASGPGLRPIANYVCSLRISSRSNPNRSFFGRRADAAVLALDGTPIDSQSGIVASCLAALPALGHHPSEALDIRRAVGRPLEDIILKSG